MHENPCTVEGTTFVSENGDDVAFVRELASDGEAQCNRTNVLL
jgi:hypothetical protein